MDADDLRKRVTRRRRALGLSIRQACIASGTGLTNQVWSAWENPKPANPDPTLTPRLQRTIALALEWPDDWPDQPSLDGGEDGDVTQRLAALEALVHTLQGQIAALTDDVSALLGAPLPSERAPSTGQRSRA